MLLGGDWKQLLPVVRNCYSSSILDYTLKRDAELWPHFEASILCSSSTRQVLRLTKNMRAAEDAQEFAQDLEDIGAGLLNDPETLAVEMPSEVCLQSEEEVCLILLLPCP